MKRTKKLLLFCFTLGIFTCVGGIYAQDVQPEGVERPEGPPNDIRGNAIRQLGLSRDQMQQIRRLNQARKPSMDEAHIRLRRATRALDEAIYSDQGNEAEVQARLKDMQQAHAEVGRIRFMHEFAVRRVLTPAQLTKFRGIRQRFEENRQNLDNRRGVTAQPSSTPPGANSPPPNEIQVQPVRQFKQNPQKRP